MLHQLLGAASRLCLIAIMGMQFVVGSAFTYGSAFATDDATPRTPDWSPFTMTYAETGYFNGRDQPRRTQVYRLTYDSRYAWSKELIESDVTPDAVGTVYAFDGSGLVIRQPLTPDPIIRPSESEGRVTVPEWWLVPGSDSLLVENRGYRVVSRDEATDRLVISRDDTIPCTGDSWSVGSIEPSSCVHEASWVGTETIVYRTDVFPAIPFEVLSLVDGEEAGAVIVTEMTVRR